MHLEKPEHLMNGSSWLKKAPPAWNLVSMAQAYPAGKEQDYSRHKLACGNPLHLALNSRQVFFSGSGAHSTHCEFDEVPGWLYTAQLRLGVEV